MERYVGFVRFKNHLTLAIDPRVRLLKIFIWDLTKGLKPFSPGERSRHLDDITSISWNRQVPHIVATSSSSGYTSVWDLKGKREAANLSYAGGATGGVGGGAMGPNGFAAGGPGGGWMGPGMGPGGRRGISAVCWHPDNVSRLLLILQMQCRMTNFHDPPPSRSPRGLQLPRKTTPVQSSCYGIFETLARRKR